MKTGGVKRSGVLLIAFLVSVMCYTVPLAVFGEPVNAEQAQAAVRGWLKADMAPLQTALGQRIRQVETFKDAQGAALYHVVYLDPEGFVIVAADDLIEPIVGFSPGGRFDPSAKNPLGALVGSDLPGRYAEVKAAKAANALVPPSAAKGKWEQLSLLDAAGPMAVESLGISTVSDVRVAPLVQTAWGQNTNSSGDACYNYYTPPFSAGSSTNYPCGCVATAMAQIMRFWQYPKCGVGTESFTITVDNEEHVQSLRGGDGAGGPYDWTNMSTYNPSTAAQRQAVGALCADAGASVNTFYSTNRSGAYFFSQKTALTNTFRYSNAVNGNNGGLTIGPGLNGMVNPNLDAGCPVVLGITYTDEKGGHWHVIIGDGYGYDFSTLYHHLNLGWFGQYDIWYNLPTVRQYTTVAECIYNVWTNGIGEIISGRVTDSAGNPIAGAEVTATRSGGGTYTAASNAQGIYALVGIPSSSQYIVRAGKVGYAFTEQTVTTGRSADSTSTSGNQWGVDFNPAPPDFTYTIDNGMVIITSYTGPGGIVSIPSTLDGYPVISIGREAFYGCTSLTSVTIPHSVIYINSGAFSGCRSLASITIPASVTDIYGSAFFGCHSLASITIPDSVTRIDLRAFSHCSSLTEVTIPARVEYIDAEAFYNCTSLTSVTIPDSVTFINGLAFYGCTSLTSVTIPARVEYINNETFHGCTSLTSVTIPDSVIYIKGGAFSGCRSLASITIPAGVTSIGDSAFSDCASLTTINVHSNNSTYVSLGGVLFTKAQTTLIQCPGGFTGNYTIPASVTSIGNGAFSGCTSLASVTIPASVTSIGNKAFSGCTNLPSVTIPDSVTNIGNYAFYDCEALISVLFTGNAPTLGSYAFDSTPATIYYRPGTTGWTNPWAGRPTAVWNAGIRVSPTSRTFKSIQVDTSDQQVFTVSNVGDTIISGTAYVSPPFSIAAGGVYNLAPGTSQDVTVRYSPTMPGNNSAYVSFSGTGGAVQQVQVTGSAFSDPTSTFGGIAGRVTNAGTGEGVNGVGIIVILPGANILNVWGSPSAFTCTIGGQDGSFSFTGLKPGTHYRVMAIAPGQTFQVAQKTGVTVDAGQTTPMNFELSVMAQSPTATPENTPVVLVRGFGPDTEWANDDSNSWSEVRNSLVSNGFVNVWDCNEPENGISNNLGTTGHFINGKLAIESNATSLISYIQQKAEQYKRTRNYYPPQIHIVSHSMGGLFTRGALGSSAFFPMAAPSVILKVGKVVMLAPPNCGSPVADYGIEKLDNAFGRLFTQQCDPRWESSRNLTTYAVKKFNQTHPWPSVPLYLISASNPSYGFGKPWNNDMDWCSISKLCIGIVNMWNGIGGTDERINDGLVTKPSVNGVYWAKDGFFQKPSLHQSVTFNEVPTSDKRLWIANPVQSITDSDLGRSLDHFFLMKDSAVANWVANTLLNENPTPTTLSASFSKTSQRSMTLAAGDDLGQVIPAQVFESLNGTVTNGGVIMAWARVPATPV